MKIAFITGCLGFIGSHFTEMVLKEGWVVIGIDCCTYAADLSLIDYFSNYKNFIFLKEDICNIKYIPDCDYIINFAAESHVENSIQSSHKFIHTNINGVNNILTLLKDKSKNTYHKPMFIHISTDEVYGDSHSEFFTEESFLNPSNPYAASKASADLLIKSYSRTYNLDYIIIRPTNNYGIRQYPEKLIPVSVKNLMREKKIKMHDNGDPIRNWMHVEDTVSGILKVINFGENKNIYNIAGGIERKNKDIIKIIIEEFHNDKNINWNDYVEIGESRPGQDIRYGISDEKLRKLGWFPSKNVDEELKYIVEWYKKNMRML